MKGGTHSLLLVLWLMLVTTGLIGFVTGQDSIIGNLPCSICGIGEQVTNSLALIPVGTVTFIERPITCFRLEFQALGRQYTPFQCVKLALNQEIKSICGCAPRPKPSAAPLSGAPIAVSTVAPSSIAPVTTGPTGPTAATRSSPQASPTPR